MSGGGQGVMGGSQYNWNREKASPFQTAFGGGYTQPNPGFGSDPMANMPRPGKIGYPQQNMDQNIPQTGGMTPAPQQPMYGSAGQFNPQWNPAMGGQNMGKIGYENPQPSAASPAVGNVRDPVTGEWSMAKGGAMPQGNAFGNYNSQPWMNNTPAWARNNNPYGARADIGSPGWQTTLRQYAMNRGQDPNAMMGGLKPLWGNEAQSWENPMTKEQGQLADQGSLMSLLRNFRSGY